MNTTTNILSLCKRYSFVAFWAILYFTPNTIQAQHAITLAPEKGDALYIGVENPVKVTVDGIAPDKVYLASDGVEIENLGGGLYNLRVSYPGKTTFTVHGEGFDYKNFDLEVKQLPDPMASMKMKDGSLKMDMEMTAEEFKKAVGLEINLPEYKGKIESNIASYNLVWVPKVGDPVEVANNTADFSSKAKSLINAAAPGDRYYFELVKANLAGATEPKQLNSLVFRIK